MGAQLLHITLSILLFFSTAGLEVNSHFCCGKFKYSTLFVQPKSCCSKKNQSESVKASCKAEIRKTPCCQNRTKIVKSESPQTFNQGTQIETQYPKLLLSINQIFLGQNFNYQKLETDYLNYKPPLIRKNFSVLFQIFLC